jgi:hypothetical protein
MGRDGGHPGQTDATADGHFCIARGILMVVQPDTETFRIVTER